MRTITIISFTLAVLGALVAMIFMLLPTFGALDQTTSFDYAKVGIVAFVGFSILGIITYLK